MSIHQASINNLGVRSSDSDGLMPTFGHRNDIHPAADSITESIHQAPVVQGGNGLVYTFGKGEALVNHYRYKVKISGKWKVKSIHIPVGKLFKVREAIANNVGVATIVTEVLGKVKVKE